MGGLTFFRRYRARIFKSSTTIAFCFQQNLNLMHNFKNIETTVLLTMLAAHAAYYKRSGSQKEYRDCARTINRIQSEIELRRKCGTDITSAKTT